MDRRSRPYQAYSLKNKVSSIDTAALASGKSGKTADSSKEIVKLNDGRFRQPIFKVRIYEKAKKFSIGQKGAKSKKFVEADDGTNLFFAIFESKLLNKKNNQTETKRSYLTISLYTMIECQKKIRFQMV